MQFKDYYKILGVESGASSDEIKRAYRKLARKYHPDVSKEPDAESRFKEIGEAYEALKDPEKRAQYDQLRQGGWRQGQEFRPPPDWGAGAQSAGDGQGFSGFSDFFESLFGGIGGAGFGNGRRPGGAGVRARGRDVHATVEIDLPTAYAGGVQRLSLGGGAGSRTLNVRIPAGVTEGRQIRLSGQGEPGMGGGPAGDLYMEVRLKPHRLFEVQGRDVHLTLPIAPWEAALGARLSVPTLGGKVEMNIPAGTSSGKRMRLKGRGLPGKTPGDQYVIVKVVVPAAESARARELYEALKAEQSFDPRSGMEGLS
ncbi:DnaJ C-terminal domain-containing protein [Wenzhouxiangella limi]|uniref:DnaJ domain-containing protein n=1 Tax=Wenzhouxiangella limi TaxID=2707351 RepID=A0A845V339_9GAMM|nr:DnaJ C-terminal domain-containing protein [Wenzhouxiangella limi]NDY97052.1 DnaJ domain-containing protein [Wenzhouxiangella limi]